MKLFLCKIVKKFISFYSPRYPLTINEKIYRKNGEINYKIMAIGEQRPIQASANEIISEKQIKEKLSPDDLMSVIEDVIYEKLNSKTYRLKEINRNGRLLIGNKNQKIDISAEDFCKNFPLIENTCQHDLFQIVSNHYFNLGRQFEEKNLSNESNGYMRNADKILKIVK